MVYLRLFLSFFQIGAVSFGGGYGMISLVRETVLDHGWLTEAEFLSFIAVSESTPGPLAVNMATFVGASQAGAAGALAATAGVVLPSFVIILIIAALIGDLLQYPAVQAVLAGVRPCVVGLILATAVTMLLTSLLGFTALGAPLAPDFRGLGILAALAAGSAACQRIYKKKPTPIQIILLSAGLGILLYGVF